MSKVRNLPDPEDIAWVECQGRALLLNTPLHCNKQSLCPACFLAQINEFEYCPIHCPAQFSPDHLAHIVCCQDDNVDRLAILGRFAAFSEHAKFWVFHVIQRNDCARVVGHTNFAARPLVKKMIKLKGTNF